MSRLPALNAALNFTAFCLLLAGWRFVKQRRLVAHQRCMWGAIGCSALFLASYLYYHFHAGHTVYRGPMRGLYLVILVSHTLLAATVVPLLWRALRPALAEDYLVHARRAKVLLPVWLYVSVTGVIVYFFVYHLQG